MWKWQKVLISVAENALLDKLMHFAESRSKLTPQWENDKTCWSRTEKVVLHKIVHFAKNGQEGVRAVWNWQNVLSTARKHSFEQTRALCKKLLKRSVPGAKMTKGPDLMLKTLFCKNLCTLLKIAKKCCAQCENDETCWARNGSAVLYKLVRFSETR